MVECPFLVATEELSSLDIQTGSCVVDARDVVVVDAVVCPTSINGYTSDHSFTVSGFKKAFIIISAFKSRYSLFFLSNGIHTTESLYPFGDLQEKNVNVLKKTFLIPL